MVTLSFLGAVRACPSYAVMGPAKAALEATARALAAELGDKAIRVNVVSPGPVRTLSGRSIPGFKDMAACAAARSPLGRVATAAEVADAATFLASDGARAVTGQTLYVDGGFSAVAF